MRMIDTCCNVKSYARKNNELKPRRCNEDFVVKIKGQCITAEEKEMLEENPGWREKIASTILDQKFTIITVRYWREGYSTISTGATHERT